MSRAILDKFLFSLRSSFAFLLVMPIPLPSPAPEGKLPAAVAHLSSCCRNELCSLLERDRERQNLLPLFFLSNQTLPIRCPLSNRTLPASRSQCCSLSCGDGKVLCSRERETRFARERERAAGPVTRPR